MTNLPQLKVKDAEEVTEEVVTTTLRRAIDFYSTIQAHDGHWPGDYGGPMFLLPGLVRQKLVKTLCFYQFVFSNTPRFVKLSRLLNVTFAY